MSEPYDLNIDLNVLNHLGLNLYSNVPAVLSEMVANAWDADAPRVDIRIEGKANNRCLVVQDNGCGMDDADLRAKYLTVGYQRRGNGKGDRTPGGREVMGRKGIGKLSVFSIAGKVQISTKAENSEPLAIELEVGEIRKAIENEETYHPQPIPVPGTVDIDRSGTVLILRDLKKRVTTSLDRYLRQRVARRFSVFSADFRVFIDGKEIALGDRNYFEKLEYALVYGDYDTSRFKHDREYVIPRENDAEEGQGTLPVRGWVGLAQESGLLQEGADNLNKISVLARGKVALEDILDTFREGGMYTKYIIGELEADFLDRTEEEDIATSSRQDFIRSDPRFEVLRRFVEGELKFLEKERERIKREKGTEKALEITAVKDWYRSLGSDSKKEAQKLFGKINHIANSPDHRKTLYRHSVLAFEHLRHKDKLNELDHLDINNLETAVKLFSELDDIEATWYHEITIGRLNIIKKLRQHISDNALEKIIQRHIYDHLWLLDPSWDRATEVPALEQAVTQAFDKVSEKLSEAERRGRLDIRYKKTSGKHVIIELKRASITPSEFDLTRQVDKYRKALRKQLRLANESLAIEVVCLVGKLLSGWENAEDRQESEESLATRNIRIVTYQQLIHDAETSYEQYLEKGKEKGRIQKLLDAIEEGQ